MYVSTWIPFSRLHNTTRDMWLTVVFSYIVFRCLSYRCNCFLPVAVAESICGIKIICLYVICACSFSWMPFYLTVLPCKILFCVFLDGFWQ